MWVLGAQCGLTPEQVLDMNIPMFQACIEGYEERLFDLHCLMVHDGYWAGYYQSRKPKQPSKIVESLTNSHKKAKSKVNKFGKVVPKPEVNVDEFLEREARRMEYLERKRKGV